MNEQALSLTEAAAQLGWSRRTLVRALERHGMPTIGTGRRARLEAQGTGSTFNRRASFGI
jgi:excisionase family DNA binding protein